jgi:hypothetical protein
MTPREVALCAHSGAGAVYAIGSHMEQVALAATPSPVSEAVAAVGRSLKDMWPALARGGRSRLRGGGV